MKNRNNFKTGNVGIIKVDIVLPVVRSLSKVIATHPGKYLLVCIVTVKTFKVLFKRPFSKLVIVPVHEE